MTTAAATGRAFGYVRVSTESQETERQRRKMIEKGVPDRLIFTDKKSGKDFDRQEYQALRRVLDKGDLVYIDELSRLGRDYAGVMREWQYITQEVGADIVILENEDLFDSRKFRQMGEYGVLMETQFLSLLAFIADQERKKMKQRQAEGITVALEKGVKFGRRKIEIDDSFVAVYDRWKEGQLTARAAMDELGMNRNTFYRRAKEHEEAAV